ncbi:hypothetical protein GGS20DRAFT_595196, partial [Poronia punctata]
MDKPPIERTKQEWDDHFKKKKQTRMGGHSDDSQSTTQSAAGGAPLYPDTPRASRSTAKSDSPSDEEKALVKASVNFGSLKDPFAVTPGVPKSVPPGYSSRGPFPQPTPSRGHGMPRQAFASAHSASRYRSSTTANNGSSGYRYRHGMNGSGFNGGFNNSGFGGAPGFGNGGFGNQGFNNGALSNGGFQNNNMNMQMHMNQLNMNSMNNSYDPNPVNELQSCQNVFASIMTVIQYINVTPGLPAQVQAQLSLMMQDVSQRFSAVTVQLRKERDEASRLREEDYERAKRAEQEVEKCRKALRELEPEFNKLKVKHTICADREKLMKNHIKSLEGVIDEQEKNAKKLTMQMAEFHVHHENVLKGYKVTEKSSQKTITELEQEVRALRGFSTPTGPGLTNISEETGAYISPDCRQREVSNHSGTSTLLASLERNVARAEGMANSMGFNPEAPEFEPPSPIVEHDDEEDVVVKKEETEDEENAPVAPAEDAVSTHSADVVVYKGRGDSGAKPMSNNTTKPAVNFEQSITPYNQGASLIPAPEEPPLIMETPWGIVYGPYPTVDENSRLPGDKMIPRDKPEWDAVDVQRALAHLYDLSKGYVANCHMKAAPCVPYDKLRDQESYTYHYFMQQVYKDQVHASNHLQYLLGTQAFIPYLLQRTCIDYLLKKLLTPTVFIGFSEQMDNHLRALQSQLASIA